MSAWLIIIFVSPYGNNKFVGTCTCHWYRTSVFDAAPTMSDKLHSTKLESTQKHVCSITTAYTQWSITCDSIV